MKKKLGFIGQRLAEEKGATMIMSMLFLTCLFGLLSLLVLIGQADLLEMKMQHTADIISKGARAAGKWTYIDKKTGHEIRTVLFATKREANKAEANIVRGAREEAEILFKLNKDALEGMADRLSVVHQKGEKHHLYDQGIYYLELFAEKEVQLSWDKASIELRRVSQSSIHRRTPPIDP